MVPDILPAGVTWKFYGSNFYVPAGVWSMFDAVDSLRNGRGLGDTWSTPRSSTTDVENSTLPPSSWLVDQDLADEHPHVGSVCAGENWTVPT